MSDTALVRRLLAGDEPAFEELFAAYFPRLFRFARARLHGNDDLAEEVVQAALSKAIGKLHTYRGEAALLTWLCAFCRTEIARMGRLHETPLREDDVETRAALEAIAALSLVTPEAELRRHEVARLVQATLDHLPGRYGDALEWRYIEGLSVDEIAGRLNLGYKAAESLLSRARQAFREASRRSRLERRDDSGDEGGPRGCCRSRVRARRAGGSDRACAGGHPLAVDRSHDAGGAGARRG